MEETQPRVLHVIRSLAPEGGGPIEGLRRLAPLARAHYQLEAASLDEPGAPYLDGFPFPVHALGPARGKFGYSASLTRWVRQHAHEYDGFVIHGLWQFHGFGTYRVIRGRKPYVAITHGMLDPWFKRQYPLKHLKKWLYWVPFEYRMLRDARAVLFTSPLEQKLAAESFWLHKWKPTVIPYGTTGPDIAREKAMEAFYETCPQVRGRKFLLYLSRIHPKKGCDLLLEAFAAEYGDSDMLLVMAGPDNSNLTPELKAQAERLGIAERVLWPGMLQGPQKWGAFFACETYVLPSHQENFGIVLAEAMACEKPVLTTTQVNIWPDIRDAYCGYVEADTLQGVAALLRNWRNTPEAERAAMGRRAYALFAERFNMQRLPVTILNELGIAPGPAHHGA